jgi:hypothetical protein
MNVRQLMELELAGEIQVLGENLLLFRFVYHKSHMTWPHIEMNVVSEFTCVSVIRQIHLKKIYLNF